MRSTCLTQRCPSVTILYVVFIVVPARHHFSGLMLLRAFLLLSLLCISDLSLSETGLSEVKLGAHRSEDVNSVASALDNKRLFFDSPNHEEKHDERKSVDPPIVSKGKSSVSVDDSVSEDGAVLNDVEANAKRLLPRADIVSNPVVRRMPKIRYEALISSAENVFIIINSLPCQAIEAELFRSATSNTMQIHCASLHESDISIVLLADKQRLRITRQTRLLGILSPGQNL